MESCRLTRWVAFVAHGFALILFVYLFLLPSKPVVVQATINPNRTVKVPKENKFNVLNFGAYGDGIHDDTTAIQDAAAAITSVHGGTVYVPPGNYIVTDTINLGTTDATIEGSQGTIIFFNPSSEKVLFSNGPVKNIAIYGKGHSPKTAIYLNNISENITIVENVFIQNWSGTSGPTSPPSIGIRINGGNFNTVRNVEINADRPVSIQSGGDHMHYSDMYLIARDPTESNFYFEAGAQASNTTIDGHCSMCCGAHGIYAFDASNGFSNLHISNLRYEQSTVKDSGHGIYLQNVTNGLIENCMVAGISLRKSQNVTLQNCSLRYWYSGTMNIDIETCNNILIQNCWIKDSVLYPGLTEKLGLRVSSQINNTIGLAFYSAAY